jgi:hypothetical protein
MKSVIIGVIALGSATLVQTVPAATQPLSSYTLSPAIGGPSDLFYVDTDGFTTQSNHIPVTQPGTTSWSGRFTDISAVVALAPVPSITLSGSVTAAQFGPTSFLGEQVVGNIALQYQFRVVGPSGSVPVEVIAAGQRQVMRSAPAVLVVSPISRYSVPQVPSMLRLGVSVRGR